MALPLLLLGSGDTTHHVQILGKMLSVRALTFDVRLSRMAIILDDLSPTVMVTIKFFSVGKLI